MGITVEDFAKALGLYNYRVDRFGANINTKLYCDGKEVTNVFLFTTTVNGKSMQCVHMSTQPTGNKEVEEAGWVV